MSAVESGWGARSERATSAIATTARGTLEGHLGGLASQGPRSAGALHAASDAMVRAGIRLGVALHTSEVAGVRVVSGLPGRPLASIASPEILARTSLSFLWLHGAIEDRGRLAASLGLAADCGDADLVASAWQTGGVESLRSVYGDYSLVAFERTGRVVAATTPGLDRRAALCASVRDGILAWATHPVLLLEREVACDPEFFARWYRADYTADLTPYRHVRRVSGGHFLALGPGESSFVSHRWWKPAVGTLRLSHDRDYEVALRDELSASVARATRGHRRVAISLSAGIDSSSLAACALEQQRAGTVDSAVGLTFATDDPLSDESPVAAEMAAHLGMPHVRVATPTLTSVADVVAQAGRLGFPSGHVLLGDSHRRVATAAIDAGATVILNGMGAEVLCAEVDAFWQVPEGERRRDVARTAASALAHVGPRPLAKAAIAYLRMRPESRREESLIARQPWLCPTHSDPLEAWPAAGPLRGMDRLITLDPNSSETYERVFLADLAIRARAPYMDRRLLELAYALPHWLRLRRTSALVTKMLARNAFPEVPHALSKQGARANLNHSLAQSWKSLFDPGVLGEMVAALPSSFDWVLDRPSAAAALSQLSDAQRFASVHELAASALWAEGMRRAGWSLS